MFELTRTNTSDGTPATGNEPYVNRGELPFDYEDLGASRSELIAKFAAAGEGTGEHEWHTRENWEADKSFARTRIEDYWDWVVAQIKQDDLDY